MTITARDVAQRARAIEDNIDEEVGVENSAELYLAIFSLLGLDPDLDVLLDEVRHIDEIWQRHYSRFGFPRTDPKVWSALGFLQGVTYTVAAQRLREEDH